MYELEQSILELNNTSPWSDDVENLFLNNINLPYKQYLLELYNNSWNKEEIPDKWKKGLLIPIAKPNKDEHNITSYRPITMLSCIGKLMERMVHKRLYWHIENYNLLNIAQAGFRKNHSTYDQLTTLEDSIRT